MDTRNSGTAPAIFYPGRCEVLTPAAMHERNAGLHCRTTVDVSAPVRLKSTPGAGIRCARAREFEQSLRLSWKAASITGAGAFDKPHPEPEALGSGCPILAAPRSPDLHYSLLQTAYGALTGSDSVPGVAHRWC